MHSGHHMYDSEPLSARKRQVRSQSSPDPYTTHNAEYPFPPHAIGAMSSSSVPLPDGASEPAVTVRRREANRLAAQRFRSRKKGYQDSLEERIKILEEDKDGLLRRLGESPDANLLLGADLRDAGDSDVRVASLESANRRLRDEIRGVYEDNDRLREELDGWRRWHHDRPRTLPPIDLNLPPFQPPLDRVRSFTNSNPSDIMLPPLRLPPLSPAISDARSSLNVGTPIPPISTVPPKDLIAFTAPSPDLIETPAA